MASLRCDQRRKPLCSMSFEDSCKRLLSAQCMPFHGSVAWIACAVETSPLDHGTVNEPSAAQELI